MIQKKHALAALATGTAVVALMFAQGPPDMPGGPGGPGGRGGSGGRGGQGGGAARGGRAGGFTQYTRPLASQDVLVRGQGLFNNNCASCHAEDLRGVPGKGNNILHSGVTMNDKKGELVGAELKKHNPSINFVDADSVAVAEYIHSILATMGGQGSPPPKVIPEDQINILVGDAKAGEAYFGAHCASCHSLAGDMKGIATKYGTARSLQNGWVGGTAPVAGGGGRGFGGGGRGGAGGGTGTVTMANGTKYTGRITRRDDFLIVMTTNSGERVSIPLDAGGPKPTVDIVDPQAAHKKMVLELDDPSNKNMHDVTAFLWTLK